MELILQIAGSKLAVSVVLGGAVWLLQRNQDRPRLSHALCLTLLAALLVPPLISIPVLQPTLPPPGLAGVVGFGELRSVTLTGVASGSWFTGYGGSGLVLAWLLGAVAVLVSTLVRARRFRRSLMAVSRGASPDLRRLAREVARTLGLAKVPEIHTTDAVVSPMAYWSGGATHVLMPSALLETMPQAELRWILAHELAHVRRRDHLVRWLEWLACTAFWWNPVAWWARRRLRAAGELCCDALVVKAFNCAPRDYARALVRAIDLVCTERTPRPPAFASAADSGRRTRFLERRIRMIITNNPPSLPRGFRTPLRCGLVALLAVGLVYCGERTLPTAADVPAPLVAPLNAELEFIAVPPGDGLSAARPVEESDGAFVLRDASFRWFYSVARPADGPRGVVVVDYDDLVPLSQNDALWAAIAELPEGADDSKFLVARQTGDGGWTFLDRIPEGSGSRFHIMTFGRKPAGVE
ncbi:M56 family metallopeptidase [Candidatus Palauibacter sp.]|uniref:M56 family metallopeptidase n=1 Tax=Candidatus Palauibacter sp. TaxID=3101350 RepID=UPI003B01803F